MTNQAKIAVFTLLLTGAGMASPQKKIRSSAAKPSVAAVPAPVANPPQVLPATPENSPATPAKVTMSNGMLTIIATNSTMADVLNGIRKATGASIDAPPAAGSERVAVNIGPADPRDALQDLFEGSKFDYIIVGSPGNDLKLQKVILTPRSGSGLGSAVANNSGQPPRPTGYQPPPDSEDTSDEEITTVPEPASPEQIPNNPPLVQPGQMIQGPDPNQNGQPQEQQQKTPEQLLQELQRIQRQQNPNQAPPTPR